MPHASDDDPLDDDLPDDADSPDDESIPEMVCPSCRGPVIDDTQQCPHCGDWITPVDPARTGWRRIVWVAVIVIMLLIMLSIAI